MAPTTTITPSQATDLGTFPAKLKVLRTQSFTGRATSRSPGPDDTVGVSLARTGEDGEADQNRDDLEADSPAMTGRRYTDILGLSSPPKSMLLSAESSQEEHKRDGFLRLL